VRARGLVGGVRGGIVEEEPACLTPPQGRPNGT
jgi:hypothetical protein